MVSGHQWHVPHTLSHSQSNDMHILRLPWRITWAYGARFSNYLIGMNFNIEPDHKVTCPHNGLKEVGWASTVCPEIPQDLCVQFYHPTSTWEKAFHCWHLSTYFYNVNIKQPVPTWNWYVMKLLLIRGVSLAHLGATRAGQNLPSAETVLPGRVAQAQSGHRDCEALPVHQSSLFQMAML